MDDVSKWYALVKKWDPNAASDAAAGETPPRRRRRAGRGPGRPRSAPGRTCRARDWADAGRSGAGGPRRRCPRRRRFFRRAEGARLDRVNRRLPLPQCRPGQSRAQYVRSTLIRQLREMTLQLPAGAGADLDPVAMKDLGISCPVLVNPMAVRDVEVIDPAAALQAAHAGGAGTGSAGPRRNDGAGWGSEGPRRAPVTGPSLAPFG